MLLENKAEGQKLCFSVPETAKALTVSSRTIWGLIKDGNLPSMKIGARVLIPTESLKAFIAERTTAAETAHKEGGSDE